MIETKPFDASRYLTDESDQIALIAEAVESGNATFIAVALGTVARARGMSHIATEAGVTREALYKALSEKGDPRLSTFLGVTKALGIRLTVAVS